MKTKNTQVQLRSFERNGQLVLALNSEILLPENAPVRRTNAQLEELDYRKLYEAYSPKGRKSVVDPKVMFKVTAYAYECGIYSTRQMEEACRYRVDFMWLLEDQPVPDHSTFARFRTGRCAEAVEDLFYQYVKYLETLKETDHEAVFIDGTKMESRAGRYAFCWRGSIEKNLVKVKAEVLKLTGLKTLRGLSKRLVKQADGMHLNHKPGETMQVDWAGDAVEHFGYGIIKTAYRTAYDIKYRTDGLFIAEIFCYTLNKGVDLVILQGCIMEAVWETDIREANLLKRPDWVKRSCAIMNPGTS